MLRLLFEKQGNAVWISHLDLMRVFQRAFKRAGLPLTHTQGFNPRPSVSIALPLSVGVSSKCELLDFELDNLQLPCEEICDRLNAALVGGVRVLDVYDDGRKLKELSLLRCNVYLEYDAGIPQEAEREISRMFSQDSLMVTKKGKNGIVEQDIAPMMRKIDVSRTDGNTLELATLICCQNPTLNPMQLHGAIVRYLPELAPDFVRCERIEIYDSDEIVFR